MNNLNEYFIIIQESLQESRAGFETLEGTIVVCFEMLFECQY